MNSNSVEKVVTRFAPSPTGLLHSGHAFSALLAFEKARQEDGHFLLRIEDIDQQRCHERFEAAIFTDLEWLGIEWENPARRQSDHLDEYQALADQLEQNGLLYPCFCTRKEILAEVQRAGGAPHGAEGPLYPGTCKGLSQDERTHRMEKGDLYALRLDLEKALEQCPMVDLQWTDATKGIQQAQPQLLGDAVLVRKDIGTSYHLAVTHDDNHQGVSHIVRGMDLFESTHLHRVIQILSGFSEIFYEHHDLITDDQGRRLAKRDQSITIQTLRENGKTAHELRRDLGFHW